MLCFAANWVICAASIAPLAGEDVVHINDPFFTIEVQGRSLATETISNISVQIRDPEQHPLVFPKLTSLCLVVFSSCLLLLLLLICFGLPDLVAFFWLPCWLAHCLAGWSVGWLLACEGETVHMIWSPGLEMVGVAGGNVQKLLNHSDGPRWILVAFGEGSLASVCERAQGPLQ